MEFVASRTECRNFDADRMAPLDCIKTIAMTSWLLANCAVAVGIDGERQEALRYLVRQDCGSCHGMTLKGGLGPALTPNALENKPAELLINSILFGRPGTPMPPWNSILTREETVWIVDQLIQGMPE